jgi:long-chain acyl-CoA synthetase
MSKEMTNGAGAGAAILAERPPLLPSRIFAGKRLVVVGGTGFLGKVWVSMLLHRFPEIAHLYLLVRPKDDQSAEERFWAQIVTSPVLDPLRERYPGAAFEAFLREKVTPVAGDVVEPLLGLGDERVASLRGKIDAVVNVAGVVDFNPPLDEALEVNAFGVNNLVALARTLGARVLHTSTCYVAGYRTGLIEEVDPREVPFPRALDSTWYGAAIDRRTLERSHWDPQREIAECLDLIKQARQRCEDAFRQSAFLDEAKAGLEARGEPTRGRVLEEEIAKVKRRFVEKQLIEAGQERAKFWGWTNIYTYTKSIGEQVLAAAGVPFTIVRPAVIESSCAFPFVGWNEGINTSAPFLYMASKGQVQFPGDRDVHLDIIPVDMVASGMITALAELIEGTAPPVYHAGTSDTNACAVPRYMELAGLYKRRQVFEGKKTGIFDVVSSRFEALGMSKKQYETHGARKIAGAMRGAGTLFDMMAHGPLRPLFKPAAEALASAAKAEDKTAEILELFIPFVAEADFVFSCANLRAAMARMPEDERARFYWEPEKIDWRHWMWEIHLPGLEKWVYPLIEEKMTKELKPLRAYDTLLDMLDEMADRHDHAIALQRLEKDGLSRVTYRALRASSLAVAARLAAIGVRPGDRVILSGANHPAWAAAYFGVLYAGAVAVPVDPGLEGPQLANVVRSSGARVALWDAAVEQKGGGWASETFPDLQAFDVLHFTGGGDAVPDDALAPPAFKAKGTDVASIIYTSGTTGDPKGVMLSHANFTALLASLAPVFPLKETDRILSVLPLHHTFEFTCGLLLPLSRGARVIYLDELNADRLGEGLQRGRITGMVGVPALWQLLERRILSRVKEKGPAAAMAFDWALDLNRMLGKRLGINAGRLFFGSVHDALGGHTRFLISGGAALPKDTAKLFAGIGLPLAEGYGLTEAAPVLTVAAASVKAKPGTVGKPVPGVEIKIKDPDDRGVGEVLARGPNVMVGYANNAEATAQAIDAEGWLHTGDLGKLDDKKRLVIVGRQKDVIVASNGENVYPDDVEALIGKLDGVKEIAIVGIDDGKGGERVACLAVPDHDGGDPRTPGPEPSPDLSYDALPPPSRAERHDRAMASLREAFQRLPRALQPAVVHLWEADLPRTATRKVKRNDVKAVLAKLAGATEIVVTEGGGVGPVRHAVAAIASKKPQEITSVLRLRADLGFDSLMGMELSVALEAQAGHALDPQRLAACDTVGDLERLVAEGGAALASEAARTVEAVEDAPIVLPKVVQDAAKRVMGTMQMGFYDRVMRPRVLGRAHVPHNRNTIVASNHASHLDMGFVKYALGTYGEGLVSLAAQDYFFEGGRLRRAYFENLTNLSPFDRKGGLRQAMRQAGDILDRGKTVLIFPEGTRSPDGRIHEFKPVIGHLALHHGVDILPVHLAGTREALPKGGKIPTRREITARIGPPLEVAELRRLTHGMRFSAACRKVAELAHLAVCTLRDGGVLDLRRLESLDAPAPVKEHPLVGLFRDLETRFVAGRVAQPITYYFTLGAESEAKWTLTIGPEACAARPGKPEGAQADCVLKTSPEIFIKIVREAYTPSPMEFMTGQIKSNDISLLQTFQKVFDLA